MPNGSILYLFGFCTSWGLIIIKQDINNLDNMFKLDDACSKVTIAYTMHSAARRSGAIQYEIIVQSSDDFIATDGCQFY